MSEIKTLLLGDNPFFGVDHLSQERSRLKAERSQSFDNMLEVMKYSHGVGASGMVVSNHPKLSDFIAYAVDNKPSLINTMEFYPIIPYVQGYVLKMNEKGMLKTLTDILSPSGGIQTKLKIITKGGIGVLKNDFEDLFKVFIDTEMLRIRTIRTRTVFLHDVLTDLALSLNLRGVFEIFKEYLGHKYDLAAGLVTKNFPALVNRLKEWGLTFPAIMTSFNKVGFQMNPSRSACEECLLNYNGNVIAMSILAAGYLRPQEAYEYIVSQPRLDSVVIGISSVEHAKDIARIFLHSET